MTMVFIAGSRQVTRLPAEVKVRVDMMIDRGFQILVGDANGADNAIQSYLAEKIYPHVLAHCMERRCRNNVGHWPTHEVATLEGTRGFDFYSAKDRAMADAAEYGLMLWEGRARARSTTSGTCLAGVSPWSSTSRRRSASSR